MFTLLHIDTMGAEHLYDTDTVSHIPRVLPGEETGREPCIGVIHFRSTRLNDRVEITSGKVYVMNDTGATVGKYDLGGWHTPE